MITIYNSQETNFETLGIGILRDFKSDPIITETLNGSFILEFDYIKKGWLSEYLIEGNIIKANKQLFRIRYISKNIDETKISVLAKHIWFDLEKNNWLEDTAPENKTAQEAIKWILDNSKHPNKFNITGSCTKKSSSRYVRMNPIDAIYNADNSILTRYGGEIELDNFNVIVHNKRGSNLGLEIRQQKNLKGATYKIDMSSLATRIMPIGYDGLLLPEKYVDSPIINSYYAPFYYKYELQDIKVDESNGITKEICFEKMRTAAQELFDNGIDKPEVSLSLDFIELSKTQEYKKYSNLETAHLGDTCKIYIPGLNISLETRIVKTIYNCSKKRITKIELGTPTPNYVTNSNNNINMIKKSLDNDNPSSFLQQAKNTATSLLKHPFGGYIYISESTGEMYILDTNDINTAQNVWKFGLGGIGYSSTGINGEYGIAITQDGKIVADYITTGKLNTNLIEGYSDLILKVNNFDNQSENISQIMLNQEEIMQQISAITDTTVSDKNINKITLEDVNESNLIYLNIYPTATDISYLYLTNDLDLTNNLYLLSRKLVFKNITNNIISYYELPCDLLYLNSNCYDEFIYDYNTETCYKIKRVGINSNGSKYALTESVNEYYTFQEILLTDGDYEISLLSFNDAMIQARAMVKNLYSTQYVTQTQFNARISQTKNEINAGVSEKTTMLNNSIEELSGELDIQASAINLKLNSSDFTSSAVIGLINNRDGTSTAKIEATNVNLNGYVTISSLSGVGTTTIDGSNIKTGTISANRLDAKVITTDNFSAQNINADRIVAGTLNADRLSGGTISSSSIGIGSSSYYLKMGVSWTKHPEVSGLNVTGSGGINMQGRSGISNCYSLSNSKGDLYLASNSGTVHIGHSSSGSNLPIEVYGSKTFINQYLEVTTNTFWVRKVNGTRITLSSYINEASSRKIKTNIKKISDNFIESLYKEVQELNLYSYDYKKTFMNNAERKNKYGFMIDDIENKNIGKLLDIEKSNTGEALYSTKGLAKLDFFLIKKLMKKIENLELEVKQWKSQQI